LRLNSLNNRLTRETEIISCTFARWQHRSVFSSPKRNRNLLIWNAGFIMTRFGF